MDFLPKTNFGKWSVKLIIAFFALFIMALLIVSIQGSRNDRTPFDNPKLFMTMFLAGLCGIGSFFTGITSIIKDKEKSPLILLSVLIGFLILFFVLGEIVIPH